MRMLVPLKALITVALFMPTVAAAQKQSFEVKKYICNSSPEGFSEWAVHIPDARVDRISALMHRDPSGVSAPVATLRFEGAETLLPHRHQIESDSLQEVQWDARGTSPEGRRLVLNAYNGRVYVDSVTVHYTVQARGRLADPLEQEDASPVSERFRDLTYELGDKVADAYQEMRADPALGVSEYLLKRAADFSDKTVRLRKQITERGATDTGRLLSGLAADARDIKHKLLGENLASRQADDDWEDICNRLAQMEQLYRQEALAPQEDRGRGLKDLLLGDLDGGAVP